MTNEQERNMNTTPVRNDGYCTEPCQGVGVLHPYHGVGKAPTYRTETVTVEVAFQCSMGHSVVAERQAVITEAGHVLPTNDGLEYPNTGFMQWDSDCGWLLGWPGPRFVTQDSPA